MDVDGLALLNCFNEFKPGGNSNGDESGHTNAILNIGSSFTNLAIIGGNTVPFVRDIAFGGNEILQKIADEKETSAHCFELHTIASAD